MVENNYPPIEKLIQYIESQCSVEEVCSAMGLSLTRIKIIYRISNFKAFFNKHRLAGKAKVKVAMVSQALEGNNDLLKFIAKETVFNKEEKEKEATGLSVIELPSNGRII